jgi:dihydropyrimidinase
MFPKKGILQVGSDADIVIFDPNYDHAISAETHHSNVDYTVYEGWKCKGGVRLTLLRGKVISENGELKGDAGDGRFIPREAKI